MFNLKMSKKMKKFFSLMLVALVMLGVTACEQNVTIDTPKSEGLSFYAEIAMTRASINDEDGDKIWNTTWESNDTLRVTDAENNSFDFVYSTTELNKFTCENPEASILEGKSVTIELVNEIPVSYNREKGLVICEQVDSFNPNSEEPIVLNPKNSFLRFTNNCYNGADITLTYPENFNCAPFVVDTNNTTSNTFSTSDSGDILVSFLVPEYDEIEYENGVPATLSYSTNGHICKEKVLKIKAGKVYNLGDLVENAEPAKIYLVPNSDWKQANAWFVAHLYDSADNYADKTLTDADADGVYECTVPAGMEKVIFCRMDSAVSNFSWDNVWNQTAETEIGVAPNNYYYINGWETGFWETADYEEPAIVWALSGEFNDWSEDACIMEATSTENLFVAKNITLEAGGAFKVKDSTNWDTNFGAGISYLKANNYMSVVKGSQTNITVEAAGTYDIYFEYLDANSKLYLMASGTDYTTAVEQTVNGEEPKQEEPEVTANMLYLQPNSNWTQSNARFAAYFFNNSGNTWVSMVDSDSDGIYEVNIPEGYVFGENVIFCRMNPSTTSNNWNNKWNQTSDLVIPTDGTNLYTVADGTWDNGGGTWSTK